MGWEIAAHLCCPAYLILGHNVLSPAMVHVEHHQYRAGCRAQVGAVRPLGTPARGSCAGVPRTASGPRGGARGTGACERAQGSTGNSVQESCKGRDRVGTLRASHLLHSRSQASVGSWRRPARLAGGRARSPRGRRGQGRWAAASTGPSQ